MANTLDTLKLNLEIIKIKNYLNEKILNNKLKNKINDYLFIIDQNNDYKLNRGLLKYNFSKYEILRYIEKYLDSNEITDFDFFKDDLNGMILEEYNKIHMPIKKEYSVFNDLNRINPEFLMVSSSIDELIYEIDINSFENEYFDANDLINQLDDFISSSIIFKFIKSDYDFSDDESSILIKRIRSDISNEKISGEIDELMRFYFNQYNVIKNRYLLNKFLNKFIFSDDFKVILKKYNYEDILIMNIIEKVRNDIDTDGTMDNHKVVLKLEYYFKQHSTKQDYLDKLNDIRNNNSRYLRKYNLKSDEFDEIMVKINIDINQGKYIKNVKKYFIELIKEKIEFNQTKSRKKLNNLITNPNFLKNHTPDEIDKINNEVGLLIYKNKIRDYEINFGLLNRCLNR